MAKLSPTTVGILSALLPFASDDGKERYSLRMSFHARARELSRILGVGVEWLTLSKGPKESRALAADDFVIGVRVRGNFAQVRGFLRKCGKEFGQVHALIDEGDGSGWRLIFLEREERHRFYPVGDYGEEKLEFLIKFLLAETPLLRGERDAAWEASVISLEGVSVKRGVGVFEGWRRKVIMGKSSGGGVGGFGSAGWLAGVADSF